MEPNQQPRHLEHGLVLVTVLLLMLLFGAFAFAFFSVSFAQHRTARESFDLELAYRSAESGVSYYLGRLAGNTEYFTNLSGPVTVIASEK